MNYNTIRRIYSQRVRTVMTVKPNLLRNDTPREDTYDPTTRLRDCRWVIYSRRVCEG